MRRARPKMIVTSFDLGFENLAVCMLDYDASRKVFPFVMKHWEVTNLGGCKTPSEANAAFIQHIARRPFLANQADLILIEQQDLSHHRTNPQNVKMKSFGHSIENYYMNQFYHTYPTLSAQDLQRRVRFYSPSMKLKLYGGDLPDCVNSWNMRKYENRKIMAILHVTKMMQYGVAAGELDSKWLRWFQSLYKKDDAADCFLQGAHYLRYHLQPKLGKVCQSNVVSTSSSSSSSDDACRSEIVSLSATTSST